MSTSNYFKHVLEDGFEEYVFLPRYIRTSKLFNFESDGFGPMQLVCDDPQWILVVEIFSDIFKRVHKEYSETYILASPELIFKPPFGESFGKFQLKIRMLEKEVYEKILKEKEKNLGQDDS